MLAPVTQFVISHYGLEGNNSAKEKKDIQNLRRLRHINFRSPACVGSTSIDVQRLFTLTEISRDRFEKFRQSFSVIRNFEYERPDARGSDVSAASRGEEITLSSGRWSLDFPGDHSLMTRRLVEYFRPRDSSLCELPRTMYARCLPTLLFSGENESTAPWNIK